MKIFHKLVFDLQQASMDGAALPPAAGFQLSMAFFWNRFDGLAASLFISKCDFATGLIHTLHGHKPSLAVLGSLDKANHQMRWW